MLPESCNIINISLAVERAHGGSFPIDLSAVSTPGHDLSKGA